MDPSASPDSKEAKDNARDLVFTRRPPTSAPEDLGETAVTRQRISPRPEDPGMPRQDLASVRQHAVGGSGKSAVETAEFRGAIGRHSPHSHVAARRRDRSKQAAP